MHNVERLEKAVAEAVSRGFDVRMEPLNGASGGLCEYGKRRWIFVDMTASITEQLEQVLSALQHPPEASARTQPDRAAA